MGVAIRDVITEEGARQRKTALCFTSFPKRFCIRLVLYPADSDALLNCIMQPQRVYTLWGSSHDGVHLGPKKDTCRQGSLLKWID
jgi:hypothetical protein